MEIDFNGHLWSIVYTLVALVIGVSCLFWSAVLVPKILNRFTPSIDEEREIAKGNRAVAEYQGRIVASLIIGLSIVIASAIIAGLL